MALFTDGPPASIEDLSAQDSQLLSVANVEGIDVSQKLCLAHEEIGMELCTLLTRTNSPDPLLWLTPKPNLEAVCVTPPLKWWHAFRTLAMVYADVYNSQLNDRYAGKRDQYRKSARCAFEKLRQNGLGIVQLPVAKAVTPTVTTTEGAFPDGTYYLTVAWVNRDGEEGVSATPAMISTASSTVAVQPVGAAPQNATGWNVYIGTAPESMIRQNSAPIAVGHIWIQPNSVLSAGIVPGCGQKPNYLQPIPRVLERG